MIDEQIQLLDAADEISDRVQLLRLELMRPAPSLYRAQDHLEFTRQRVEALQEAIGRIDPAARIGSRG